MSRFAFLQRSALSLAAKCRSRLKFGVSRPGPLPPTDSPFSEDQIRRPPVSLPCLPHAGQPPLPLDRLPRELPTEPDGGLLLLNHYLKGQCNAAEDIARLPQFLAKPRVILEIGCGSCEVAWQIARKNPDVGMIATDQYNWDAPPEEGSYYQKVALAWRERCLPVEQAAPENLLILRAEGELLRFLPDRSIDTLLLINAEPAMGNAFVDFLVEYDLLRKIRPGDRQVVMLPYCREMGVMACGGYEFEHSEDWSRGLSYIMNGRLRFRRGDRQQWGVDLLRASPYSRNSTQSKVFIYGDGPAQKAAPGLPAASRSIRHAIPGARRRKPGD